MSGIDFDAKYYRSPEFRAYLVARGISEESADKCLLHSISLTEHADFMEQPRLLIEEIDGGAIPFFDLVGKELEGFGRTRLLKPFVPNGAKGKTAKFLQPPNSVPHLYLPPMLKGGRTWKEVALDPSIPVLITEGEIKSINACQAGYTCMAVIGVWSFLKRGDEGESSQLIDDLVMFDWRGRIVHIVFDSDAALNPKVRQAEERLVRELFALGAKPFIVRLPATRGVGKQGLDDLLTRITPAWRARQELNKLIAAAVSPVVPTVVSSLAIKDLPVTPVVFAIMNLLPHGLSMLVSRPKVGKSFMDLQMGHAIVLGGPVFGSFTTRQSDVLYIALEDRNLQRIASRLKTMGLAPVDGLQIATQWPQGDDAYAALTRYLEDNPLCKVVFVDTWQRFRKPSNVKSNSSDTYAADYLELALLKAVADRFDIAILVTHHLKKGTAGSDIFEQVLGSTALTGAVDSTIVIERKRNESRATVHVTGRDIVEQEMAFDFDQLTCTWQALSKEEAATVATTSVQSVFISVLTAAAAPMQLKTIAEAVGEARGRLCSPSAAHQTLQRLINEGLVFQNRVGLYELAQQGTETAT